MDSLVRTPKNDIIRYLEDFFRVLKVGGFIYLHLPSDIKPLSVSKGFTSFSHKEIEPIVEKIGFENIIFDFETLEHGILLIASKK